MRFIYIIILSLISFLSFSQHDKSRAKVIKELSINSESEQEKKLRLQIEADPANLDIHEKYQRSEGMTVEKLISQYSIWMQNYPGISNIPFSIGKRLYLKDSPMAREYLLKSVHINPQLAEAWEMLAVDAQRWGNKNSEIDYLRKAIASSPKNPAYALRYAQEIKKIDLKRSDSLMLDVALRYPKSDAGAKALNYLAREENSEALKIAYYDRLYKSYHELQPPMFREGMSDYFSFLINKDAPENAFELALNMMFIITQNKLEWKHKIKVARAFLDARESLQNKKYAETSKILDSIKLVDDFSNSSVDAFEKLLLLKAYVWDLKNETKCSYDSLLKHYSLFPTDVLRNEMYKYAGKLGKDSLKVQDEINAIHQKRAIPATPFSLLSYYSDKRISLEDFKGKVVLLTFWFPGCGPCRGEYLHFERVIRNFSKDDIAYLAVNVRADQDGFVLPFLKNTGYSFTPLKDDPEWDKATLSAWAFPANYIIDKNGDIIYSKFYINEKRERTLELMISGLLESSKKE